MFGGPEFIFRVDAVLSQFMSQRGWLIIYDEFMLLSIMQNWIFAFIYTCTCICTDETEYNICTFVFTYIFKEIEIWVFIYIVHLHFLLHHILCLHQILFIFKKKMIDFFLPFCDRSLRDFPFPSNHIPQI